MDADIAQKAYNKAYKVLKNPFRISLDDHLFIVKLSLGIQQ